MDLGQLDKIASEIKDAQAKKDQSKRNEYLIECLSSRKDKDGKIQIEDCIVDGLNGAIDIATSDAITVTLKTLIKLGIIHIDEK